MSLLEIVKITENINFFGQRWHLVTLGDTFFSKLSPFKITIIFEDLKFSTQRWRFWWKYLPLGLHMRFFRKEKIQPKNIFLQSYRVLSFYQKMNIIILSLVYKKKIEFLELLNSKDNKRVLFFFRQKSVTFWNCQNIWEFIFFGSKMTLGDTRWHFFFKSVTFENHRNLWWFDFFHPKVTLLMKLFIPWASYEIFSKRKKLAKKYFTRIV